jgi:hypothetical protein
MSVSEVDAAWAAGFYEGEGYCRCRHQTDVEVIVSQVDLTPLMKLQFLFDGSIKPTNSTKYNPNASQSYQWRIYGQGAIIFIKRIAKYLSPRRLVQAHKILIG